MAGSRVSGVLTRAQAPHSEGGCMREGASFLETKGPESPEPANDSSTPRTDQATGPPP